MNLPGSAQGNWRWRLGRQRDVGQAFRWLAGLTGISGRGEDPISLPAPATVQWDRERIPLVVQS